MNGLVWFLVTRLHLNIAELVQAFMMFEECVAPAAGRKGIRPGLLGINYVRRLFFGCCSLAIKVGHDVRADSIHAPHDGETKRNQRRLSSRPSFPIWQGDVSLQSIRRRVRCVFTALRGAEMPALEAQVLKLLDWRIPSTPAAARAYANAIFDAASQAGAWLVRSGPSAPGALPHRPFAACLLPNPPTTHARAAVPGAASLTEHLFPVSASQSSLTQMQLDPEYFFAG